MATFRKRASGFWQAVIRRKGHAAQSASFEKKEDAEKWARDIESRMDRGVFEDRREAETTTLRAALERYEREVTSKKKAQRQEKNFIKRWLERKEFSERMLTGIKSADFAAWRDKRLKVVSTQTVRHELKLISHLYNVAAKEWGMPIANPLASISMPSQGKSRERRLSTDEERYLLSAAENSGAVDKDGKSRANPWIAPIIKFALATAMRQSEILALTWKHVDTKDKLTATLDDTKNGERRVVPLSPAALAVLAALPRTLRGPVFSTTQVALVQSWKRCLKRAQRLYADDCETTGNEVDPDFLEDLHFHDLRHEAISRLFELGLDAMTVSEISGHKTLSQLKRYTHLNKSDIAQRLAKLEALRAAEAA